MPAMRYARVLSILGAALIPGIALAAAPRTFQELANVVVVILNNATIVLVVAGIVVYFYGISTNILKMGEDNKEKVRTYFLWGIIVLFLMVSIWGVLRLLQDTLFGGDQALPSDTGGIIDTSPPTDVFQSPAFQG